MIERMGSFNSRMYQLPSSPLKCSQMIQPHGLSRVFLLQTIFLFICLTVFFCVCVCLSFILSTPFICRFPTTWLPQPLLFPLIKPNSLDENLRFPHGLDTLQVERREHQIKILREDLAVGLIFFADRGLGCGS